MAAAGEIGEGGALPARVLGAGAGRGEVWDLGGKGKMRHLGSSCGKKRKKRKKKEERVALFWKAKFVQYTQNLYSFYMRQKNCISSHRRHKNILVRWWILVTLFYYFRWKQREKLS